MFGSHTHGCNLMTIIIIIQEICKAPTLWLKVLHAQYKLNTYMYIEVMNVVKKRKKEKKMFIY